MKEITENNVSVEFKLKENSDVLKDLEKKCIELNTGNIEQIEKFIKKMFGNILS